jgi:tetrapyrrole methylase family protein/MazG family protein
METKFIELVKIIKKLREPDGCPWDKEQDLYSLKEYLIEETYELIDALDNKNIENIKEELGDILLHVIFHANIAEEDDLFTLKDVIETIKDKMIRRHPHVFGDTKADTTEEVLKNWDIIKSDEKQERKSVFDSIPTGLPPIQKSFEIQKKASKVGFDWKCTEDCLKKVEEEFSEFKEAMIQNDKEKMEHELGDMLFSLINISRFLEVNPDQSLRKANIRFMNRFKFIEEELSKSNKSIEEASLEEMDELWEKAKDLENKKAAD